MSLRIDAIADRLERLKGEDKRILFDSKIRAIRRDRPAPAPHIPVAARPARPPDAADRLEMIVSMLEDLSSRLDALEKKNNAIVGEVRGRAERDRRRRWGCSAIGLVAALAGWAARSRGWI